MTSSSPLQGAATVDQLCQLGRLSHAGYYRFLEHTAPARADADLRDAIHRIALAHKHYGYRPVTAALKRLGIAVNAKRVLRLMREDNLLVLRTKAFVPRTTDSDHGFRIAPNLIRSLIPTGLDQIWVADITYVRLAEAFVYLAVILDAFSRRVVGWALDDHLRAGLALAALQMALDRRPVIAGGLIHHSDRGVQYACGDYVDKLRARGIQPSMSRVGCPYDNAMAESFMKTLKTEEVDGQAYRDLAHARGQIGSFIEEVYNRQRLHSALDYLTPEEYEATLSPLQQGRAPAAMASINLTCP